MQHEDFKLGKSAPPSGHVQQLKHLLQNSAFLSYRSQHKQKSWQNTARFAQGADAIIRQRKRTLAAV